MIHSLNTRRTRGGPGGRDRTLTVKRRKNLKLCLKIGGNKISTLGVPPKWVNQIKPVEHEDEVDDSESYNENKDDSRVGKARMRRR